MGGTIAMPLIIGRSACAICGKLLGELSQVVALPELAGLPPLGSTLSGSHVHRECLLRPPLVGAIRREYRRWWEVFLTPRAFALSSHVVGGPKFRRLFIVDTQEFRSCEVAADDLPSLQATLSLVVGGCNRVANERFEVLVAGGEMTLVIVPEAATFRIDSA